METNRCIRVSSLIRPQYIVYSNIEIILNGFKVSLKLFFVGLSDSELVIFYESIDSGLGNHLDKLG